MGLMYSYGGVHTWHYKCKKIKGSKQDLQCNPFGLQSESESESRSGNVNKPPARLYISDIQSRTKYSNYSVNIIIVVLRNHVNVYGLGTLKTQSFHDKLHTV